MNWQHATKIWTYLEAVRVAISFVFVILLTVLLVTLGPTNIQRLVSPSNQTTNIQDENAKNTTDKEKLTEPVQIAVVAGLVIVMLIITLIELVVTWILLKTCRQKYVSRSAIKKAQTCMVVKVIFLVLSIIGFGYHFTNGSVPGVVESGVTILWSGLGLLLVQMYVYEMKSKIKTNTSGRSRNQISAIVEEENVC